MSTAPRRILTLLVTALVLVATFGNAATAEPTPGADEDGGQNLTVRQALDKATAEYNDAKGRLDKSMADQASIGEQMTKTQARLTELQAGAGTIAAAAYRGRRVSLVNVIVGAENADDMMHNMVTVQYMLQQDDKQLRELAATQQQLQQQQQDIANAVANQQAQLKIMETNKKAAEDALRKAGGGADAGGGAPSGGKVTTNGVARNSDGSLPKEGCTLDDPTTSGCISPRTLNVYNEARRAGFTHYTSCHRNGGGGDHPLGKACDFSANATTFVNARATGADKTYGDSLAAWAIANAKNLGIKYVIWYKRIWQPSSGWKSYGGDGTPAGDHYNHVHISVQ
ncbi:coiled-coil domain-containing protein [Dactylosporangium sp. CA-092794]|uniref:coiled-coil domain-containing protein n=1 Tax=Dactylosporangium sp. CA-092794 TaxID=3239929 RepID=UPI003D8DAA1F